MLLRFVLDLRARLGFVEENRIHVSIQSCVVLECYNRSVTLGQPEGFHQAFSLKIRRRGISWRDKSEIHPHVQKLSLTFTSISPRGSVLNPPISCNSSFTSEVMWILEAKKEENRSEPNRDCLGNWVLTLAGRLHSIRHIDRVTWGVTGWALIASN